MLFFVKNKYYYFLSLIIVFFILTVYSFYSGGISRAKSARYKNYWKSGKISGQKMTACESGVVGKAVENAKIFCMNLKNDNLTSDHFNIVINKAGEMFSKSGLIDYKDLALTTNDKKSFNVIDKMFKNRKKYRDSLTKNDSDCLKSGIRKLTIEQKFDVCGGYFVMI